VKNILEIFKEFQKKLKGRKSLINKRHIKNKIKKKDLE